MVKSLRGKLQKTTKNGQFKILSMDAENLEYWSTKSGLAI